MNFDLMPVSRVRALLLDANLGRGSVGLATDEGDEVRGFVKPPQTGLA